MVTRDDIQLAKLTSWNELHYIVAAKMCRTLALVKLSQCYVSGAKVDYAKIRVTSSCVPFIVEHNIPLTARAMYMYLKHAKLVYT